MRNSEKWKTHKFVKAGPDKFRSTREKEIVGVGSRYIVSLQAEQYSILLKKYAAKKLLDLGCGEVPLYEMYKDKVDEIICCDWNLSYHKAQYLDFILDMNKPLPMKNSSFDTIVLSDVLEHLLYPELIFSEIGRILKPDGILFLSIPFLYGLHEEPYDYNRFTEFKLRKFCENNDLNILYLEPYGGSLEFLSDFLLKHLSRIQPDFLTIILIKILHIITQSRIGKKIFKKTSRKFPLGYCMIAKKGVL